LRIPKGVFFNKNHTWSYLEKSGTATVGIDDLLLHLTGDVRLNPLKKRGDLINKGDLLAEINQRGKLLKVFSPISGEIAGTNPVVSRSTGKINEDPYGKGWIYKIKPNSWIAETSTCYMAEEAVEWSKRELERFRDFMAKAAGKYSANTSMVILQDGGELCDKPLSELPDDVWKDFQGAFLN
jgi:glycine cleavage system H protein